MLNLPCKLLEIIEKYAKNNFIANLDVSFNFTFNLEHFDPFPTTLESVLFFLDHLLV